MRIYVACLAAYNNGVHHGEWLDLGLLDIDEARSEIKRLLIDSPFPNVTVDCMVCDGDGTEPHPAGEDAVRCEACNGTGKVASAEEWAIHDHEGFPNGLVGEYSRLEELYEYVEAHDAAEHFGMGEALDALILDGETVESAARLLHDGVYCGAYDSFEDYAEQYVADTGLLDGMPENLRGYFDMEAFARDLSYDMRVIEFPGGVVHVFHN